MKNFGLLLAIIFLSAASPVLANALMLVPGGENIAFEIYSDGIIVTGSYNVDYLESNYNPNRDSDIIKGDIIYQIGDKRVTDLKSFTSEFYRYKDDGILPLMIKRSQNQYYRELRLIKDDNSYKTGLYVKERILGIGTVSFYDPVNKTYGALAHEVYDDDTASIIDVRVGAIYLEEVESITPSKDGDVGSKNCDVDLEDLIGDIIDNTSFGIFGNIDEIPSSYEMIEVANVEDIKLGKAIIRTCVKDDKLEDFEIQITALKKQKQMDIKGISFTITDEDLLQIGGGIYQGMSGSPIIQDNKLIGAVTHVNVNNVETGYGVYMQYMYQKSLESFA